MKALVTGGGGFLGKAIVAQLLAEGHEVHTIARQDYPELRQMGARTFQGDIAELGAVREAADGCDVVFHVAAKAGIWGPREEYERINVRGTRYVIHACLDLGIQKLVFTSSPSVVYGREPLVAVDERVPYPKEYLAEYPRTKALAEQMVLQAAGPRLATVALRPHLIWGPGDNHLVPRIVARAKSGKLRKVGDGKALVDTVYIDDAARAHLLAAKALAIGEENHVTGRAYFISSGKPVAMGEMLDRIVGAAGLPPVTRHIPAGLAYAAGFASEVAYRLLGKTEEPLMTRFLAKQLSTAHHFNIRAAKRDFGYEPQVSLEEGMQALASWIEAGGLEGAHS